MIESLYELNNGKLILLSRIEVIGEIEEHFFFGIIMKSGVVITEHYATEEDVELGREELIESWEEVNRKYNDKVPY